jgi:hypothetical protein
MKFLVLKGLIKKYWIVFLGLFISFSLKAQNVNPRFMKVFSVNIYTTATTSVSCSEFLMSFQSIIRTNVVSNLDSIRALESLLKQAKYSRKQRDIDVRVKVFIEGNNTEPVEICSDGFSYITVNGQLIKKNNKLLSFIRSVMPRDNVIFGGSNKPPSM